jgi:prepilin-type N-terminal cleavage/methylation domain-containing protein/prepilin-type processing-associated H-X9-DG protein
MMQSMSRIQRVLFGCRDSRACSRRPAAFTLIELLIVVSVISLLLAIAVPSFSRAKNCAKTVFCGSQMREIAFGVHLHAKDNEGFIVRAGPMPGDPNVQQLRKFWMVAVMPYLGDTMNPLNILADPPELWRCPVDKDPYPEGFGGCPHGGVISYALNGYAGAQLKLGPAGGYKISQIKQSSSCMLIGETSFAAQFYDVSHPSVAGLGIFPIGHHRMTSGFYHNGSMNIAYVDGHTSSVKGSKTDELVWPMVNTAAYQEGQYMYWPDLTLPTAEEEPAFWGPGY